MRIKIILLIFILAVPCRGSLNITADGTDRITISNTADIQDQNAWTQIWWWRWATSFNDFGRMAEKGTGGLTQWQVAYSGSLANGFDIKQTTSGTDVDFRTGDLSVINSDDTWQFLAISLNLANGAGAVVNIYYGNLTTIVSLIDTDGTGTGNSTDGVSEIEVGNNHDFSMFGLGGDIAMYQYWNKEMTLGEVRAQQFNPHPDANCQVFLFPGFNGATNCPDYSGNGNAGTGTGTTVDDHVPLGPPFGAEIPIFLVGCLLWINRKKAA